VLRRRVLRLVQQRRNLDRPTRKPTAAKPASAPTALSPSARKHAVAERLILAAAQIAATWEYDEITADEARTMISSWMNYLPGGVWDERLGERSGAGRRAK
jgi:hypothetical protein